MAGGNYRWFADEFSHCWIEGFCLTFIADKPADVVKDALVSSPSAQIIDVEDEDQLFIASLYEAGNGSIMLERGGHAGYMKKIAALLSLDTCIAIIVYFIIGSPKFAYVDNGTLVCGFHIMDPEGREGSSPDILLPQLMAANLLPVDRSAQEWEDEEGEIEEGGESEGIDRVLRTISVAAQLVNVPFERQLLESPRHFMSMADLHISDSEAMSRYIF
ncbi:DUF6461 domain-containing protein [Nonomuraea sp. NPDC001831]|uniref:DUF6461 domain-containing protein n=1 Tax=Nonomuraea sp. NPDC001831 TaxID=3364340 RepID=UPI0036837139